MGDYETFYLIGDYPDDGTFYLNYPDNGTLYLTDYPDNGLSFLLAYYPVWYTSITTIIGAFSVTSNIFILRLYLQKCNRSQTTVLLSVLAASDGLCVTACAGLCYIKYLDNKAAACKLDIYLNYVAMTCHTFSLLVTTIIAVQRFIICALPMRGPTFCNRTFSSISVVSAFVVSVVYWTFRLSIVTNKTSVTEYNSINITVCYYKDLFINSSANNFVWPFRLFVFQVVPLFVTTISMGYCIYAIRQRRKFVEQNVRQQRKIQQTTIIICMLTGVLVIGELLTTAQFAYIVFEPEEPNIFQWLQTRKCEYIANVMIFTSFFINIWIYLGMSAKFRQSMLELVTCRT